MSDKRYWVKMTLEVHSYNEKTHQTETPILRTEMAPALTPEPVLYIRDTLVDAATGLAEALAKAAELKS